MSACHAFRPVAAALLDYINRAAHSGALDAAARSVWAAYGEGNLSDDEASALQAAVEQRRPRRAKAPDVIHVNFTKQLRGPISSRFQPRQVPRSPDRLASRMRRRRLGLSGEMPHNLACHYTEGQRAVLSIVAREVRQHGHCALPVDKIGALAGVCRSTVQATIHEARRLGHIRVTERPVPGRKHLPNVIAVISAEWLAWLRHGRAVTGSIGSNSLKNSSTTKNQSLQEKAFGAGRTAASALRGVQDERVAPFPQPRRRE